MQRLREHHQVWKDAQFGDPVLDMLHLLDKMGFEWRLGRDPEAAEPTAESEQVAQEPLPAAIASKNGKRPKQSANKNGSVRNVQPRKGARAAARKRASPPKPI
jgi:hypothetical protein